MRKQRKNAQPMSNNRLSRTHMLLGDEGMKTLLNARVIIFGIGGVGSWCAESLIRTGLRHLTIVDADRINESNINRQLHATMQTIGQVKVDAMRDRLLSIDPEADIECIYDFYSEETAERFDLDKYDYIVDAIDSLSAKAYLISKAQEARGVLVSSMGAALKVDPTRVRVADFWDVQGCPLGSKLRKMLRKQKKDVGHFRCVFSDEVLENRIEAADNEPQTLQGNGTTWNTKKVRTNGSLVHITAIFGFTLAGEIMKMIMGSERLNTV